jgi:hypothetical protein
MWEIDAGSCDLPVPATLKMLLEETEKLVGKKAASSLPPPPPAPKMPADGKLSASGMCGVIAAVQPEAWPCR